MEIIRRVFVLMKKIMLIIQILFIFSFISCFASETHFEDVQKFYDGNEDELIEVVYYDYLSFSEGNLPEQLKENDEIIGFLKIKKISDKYFSDKKRCFFKFVYEYSSIEGEIRKDFKNLRQESNVNYITYRQSGIDFGGKNDCGDCGTPLSYGYGQGYFDDNPFGINGDNIIYIINYAVDRTKTHTVNLNFSFEEQPYEKIITVE